jgi:hypothetical protein
METKMGKATVGEINTTIRMNAISAIDQRGEYPTLTDALQAYWINVEDTLVIEGGMSHADFVSLKVFEKFRTAARKEARRVGVPLSGVNWTAGSVER